MNFNGKVSSPNTLGPPWCVVNRSPFCETTVEVSHQIGNSSNKIESSPLDLKIRSSGKM